MKTTLRTLRDIAVRTAILLGFNLSALWMLGRFDNSPDANIGAGLLIFAGILMLGGLGGLCDGWRGGFARLTVTWSATAVLTAIGMIAVIDPALPVDVDVFLSDLRDLGGFLTALVAIPALLGGALGALIRSGSLPSADESSGADRAPQRAPDVTSEDARKQWP